MTRYYILGAKILLVLALALPVAATALRSSVAAAATNKRYITDMLYVPIRSGPSIQNKVFKNLKTGQAVQLVKGQVPQNGYALVKTTDNLEGWVPLRYLLDEPTAALKLEAAQQQAAEATEKWQTLQAANQSLASELRAIKGTTKSLASAKEDLNKQYESLKKISGSSLDLAEENENLAGRVAALSAENEQLRSQNIRLSGDSQNEGIKLGVMAVLFGVFLGFVFPYLKPRARRSSGLKLR